jgi:putative AlgH/UPF0301 family transcriptional regulator
VGKLLYIFRAAAKPADSDEIVEVASGVYLGWNAEKLKELLKRAQPTEGLRVYAGHSAWSPGQLEAEVARGAWTSAKVDVRSIFEAPAHLLWPELHRRASLTPVKMNGVRVDSPGVDSDPTHQVVQPPPSAFMRSTE